MEKTQTTFPINIQKVLTPYAKNKNKNKKQGYSLPVLTPFLPSQVCAMSSLIYHMDLTTTHCCGNSYSQ